MRKNLKIQLALFAVLAAAGVVGVLSVTGRASAELTQASADAVNSTTNSTSQILTTGGACSVASGSETSLSSRGTKTMRVTANGTMTAQLRGALVEWGARIIAPVGPCAVLIEATPETAKCISSDARFTADDVLPAAKVQETLAEMCVAKEKETVPVAVVGLAAADRAILSSWVVSEGGSLRQGPDVPEILYAEIPTGLVASLAERGDVRWIEYCPDYKLLNDCSVVATAANVDTIRAVHKLRGRGQTVAIYDSGFDTGDKANCHLDFSGRVKAIVNEKYTKADYMGHGTHCAGTILGDGARSVGRYKGMAPEAQLFAQSAGDKEGSTSIYLPGTPEHIFASCLSGSAYIHSDSWGGDTGGEYTTLCKGLDDVMWNHSELLVVVACGNAGNYGMGTVGSPAAAKNALTVGNSYSTRAGADPENLNISSSRGPTKDSRIKPEIVAPGTRIYSARSSMCKQSQIAGNPYYTEMTGTSMATPLIAGSAALVRQWLVDRRDFTNALPTAALIKAILTGGGVAMTGTCGSEGIPVSLPNNYIGWGRLNLEETLYPSNGRAVKFADRISFRDGFTETIELTTTNNAPLDVQLCWIDYPADESADKTLVNDLDLIVSNKTTHVVWYGNGVTGGDHQNTMESVRISLADAGDYAILVKGFAVPYDSTEGGAAAVYIRGAFEDETKPDPECVRNVRTGVSYEFLDEAIQEVQSGDTLEILEPIKLAKSVTLTNDCTLFATNPAAAASLVTRVDDAALTVANDATLMLSNVVFSASGATLLTVQAGGNVTLGANVNLGVGIEHVAISTADANGFILAGPLVNGLMLQCASAVKLGDKFGTVCLGDGFDRDAASASAARIVEARDTTGELRGIIMTGETSLVWGAPNVPLEDAAGYFVDASGTTNTAARLDRLVEKFKIALGGATAGVNPTMTLLRSGDLSEPLKVSGPVTICGADDVVITCLGKEGLTVTNGTLSVSGLMFDGFTGDDLFTVKGKGALLRLSDCMILGDDKRKNFTAVKVAEGTAELSDVVIRGCLGGGDYGGGVYVGSGAAVSMSSCEIVNCQALSNGGGVYVSNGAQISIAGDMVVTNNVSDRADDIYLAGGDAALTVVGKLGVRKAIGIRSGVSDVNEGRLAFAVNGLPEGSSKTVTNACERAFFNDVDANSVATAVEMGFVWKERSGGKGSETDGPGMIVVVSNTVEQSVLYYSDVAVAFDEISDDSVVMLRSQDRIEFGLDLVVDYNVRLTTEASVGRGSLGRTNDCSICVNADASLTVDACMISGGVSGQTNAVPLILVDGGALTLSQGALIQSVSGDRSSSANAVTVQNKGRFTMEDGASISLCGNAYKDDPEGVVEIGTGGALLLRSSTAFLRGGVISNCHARVGGGVYADGSSKIYVAGDIVIRNNLGCDSFNLESCERWNDLVVTKGVEFVLDGTFGGSVGYTEKKPGNTNVFGRVDAPVTASVIASATNFWHNVTKARGVVATNATGAVLAWADAFVKRGGVYVVDSSDAKSGETVTYYAATKTLPAPATYPDPGEEPGPVPPEYAEPTPIAFKSIARISEGEWALVITDRVQWAEYRLIGTDDLTRGFVYTGAWEQATAAGPWTTNVLFTTPVPASVFWKAEAQRGQIPGND